MNDDLDQKNLEDKILVCSDCGNRFIWTIGEQQFFISKGLTNAPKRCKPCSAKNKERIKEKHPSWAIICKNCGQKGEVSFQPKSDDTYCSDCFKKMLEERDHAIKALGEEIPE